MTLLDAWLDGSSEMIGSMIAPALFWGRFVLIAVFLALVLAYLRSAKDRRIVVREFVLMLGAYLAYSFVRNATQGSQAQAHANAHSIERFERRSGYSGSRDGRTPSSTIAGWSSS